MMGRVIWKGNIHFGGIDVPVKLHTAVKEERIQFHLLHRRDHVKLQQQMICAHEKVPVPAEEQTRGFELTEGKYLLIDPDELELTEPERSRAIDVHEFVKSGQIDSLFLERTYYLEPDVHGKGYNALAAAMAEMGVDGICSWTMRKRSYLGALAPSGNAGYVACNLDASVVVDGARATRTGRGLSVWLLEDGEWRIDDVDRQ